LALRWIYPNIFSPSHVIILELIMGPTCSIIFENEPIEKNLMIKKPRPFSTTFFNYKELTTSIIQGLAITIGTLIAYQYSVSLDFSENTTRTMVFMVLIVANIFLTLVNRSFYYSILTTLKYKNNLVPLIISLTILLSLTLLYVPALTRFLEFERLTIPQLGSTILIGAISVLWYELVKGIKRCKKKA
jgi:Ca2+-transporting ATPase